MCGLQRLIASLLMTRTEAIIGSCFAAMRLTDFLESMTASPKDGKTMLGPLMVRMKTTLVVLRMLTEGVRPFNDLTTIAATPMTTAALLIGCQRTMPNCSLLRIDI